MLCQLLSVPNNYFHTHSRDQLTKDDDERILSDGDEENRRNEGQMNVDEPMDEFEALIDEQIALTTVHSRSNIADKSFGNISSISSATQPSEQSISVSTFQPPLSSSHHHQPLSQAQPPLSSSHHQPSSQAESTELTSEMRARIAENRLKALAILEKRKAEAEEKRKQELEAKQKTQEISNVNFDDDDF